VPAGPSVEPRRAGDFASELLARARAWISSWSVGDNPSDFGLALLQVAARFSGEVAQRLDYVGEKQSLGFLDWLAVRGSAAFPARAAVAFKLADSATDPVLAPALTQLQADAQGVTVVFETEGDVLLVPGTLEMVVGADPAADAFYLPPPGLTSLEPLEPLPSQWRLKSLAPTGATTLQLDPALGLAEDRVLEIAGAQYVITAASGGLVSITPAVAATAGLAQGTVATKVTTFRPFDGITNNQQLHALYIGDDALLNLDAAASIKIVNGQGLAAANWAYWGKAGSGATDAWQALDPPTVLSDGLLLAKPAGSVDEYPVGPAEIKSRWLRGTLTTSSQSVTLTSLELVINPDAVVTSCTAAANSVNPGATAEGFANSTALDFNSVFYPFGREPRLFDTFYLGCAEAFSKADAEVGLCFELDDPNTLSLAPVRNGKYAFQVLAGVGTDGALHLFAVDSTTGAVSMFLGRDALQPPSPGNAGAVATGPSTSLDPAPPWRLPVWGDPSGANPDDFAVGTAAGLTVWIWHENAADQTQSGWISLDPLPGTSVGPVIDGLCYQNVAPAGPTLYALVAGQIYSHDATLASGSWSGPVDISSLPVSLTSLVSIVDDGTLAGYSGILGVGSDGKLYAQTTAAVPVWNNLTPAAAPLVDPTVRPAALVSGGVISAFGVVPAAGMVNQELLAISTPGAWQKVALVATGDSVVGQCLEAIVDTSQAPAAPRVIALAAVRNGSKSYLASWAPFDVGGAAATSLFTSNLPTGMGPLGGAPTALQSFVVVPGDPGLLTAGWNPARRFAITVPPPASGVLAGVVVPASVPALAPNDIVMIVPSVGPPTFSSITANGTTVGNDSFYPLDAANPGFGVNSGALPLFAFRNPAGFNGIITNVGNNGLGANPPPNWSLLTLDPTDHTIVDRSFLLFQTLAGPVLSQITLNPGTSPQTGNLNPPPIALPLGHNAFLGIQYWHPEPIGGRVAPWMNLDPASNGKWDAGLLKQATLRFDGTQLQPDTQTATAFATDVNGYPLLLALDLPWTFVAAGALPNVTFVLDAAVGLWAQPLGGGAASNPTLAWEYWNGTSWWKLAITQDQTLNLTGSGLVRFTVPPDLATTDVSGRSSYWIRVRLVGGDYGEAQISVVTVDLGGGKTQTTVQRSTDTIHPPAVISLHVRYVSAPAAPSYLLTQDSGSYNDQSDANRAGAQVSAFVPLSELMMRLTTGLAAATPTDTCLPDCACTGSPSTSPPTTAPTAGADGAIAAGAATTGASAPYPASGRALFLGLNATLLGTPIKILLLVDEERPLDGFAPLAVDALIGGRFSPLVLHDTTRALGESGVLELDFPVQPQPTDLFGATLTWLRLRPSRQNPNSQWNPTLAGVYLNASWATAAETMTREPVGSSDGRPQLTLQLARPPLLADTLELRVLEPLSDEDRQALIDANPAADPPVVIYTDPDLPGNWVLWQQVVDPADWGPEDRVYALDETLGQITFGGCGHGMIPPIGTDAVVAFSYRRTEPGPVGGDSVPADAITARTQLSLVSPIEGVESVFAATDAAGGAPPESPERVLRFGTAQLRHRGRALTAADYEDLTLQSFIQIAQARCFPQTGGVRMVVVMRGMPPTPSAAVKRALYQVLVSAAPVALGIPNALQIAGPRLRQLRIDLALQVPSLDDSGNVADKTKIALTDLFDTGAGGYGNGWELGRNPLADDIALALMSIPRLDSISSIVLNEIAADGTDSPWSGNVQPDELVVLADEPVRLVFESLEVSA
jgi:hypothetical protein